MIIDVERLRCFIQTLIAYKRIITHVMMNNKGEAQARFFRGRSGAGGWLNPHCVTRQARSTWQQLPLGRTWVTWAMEWLKLWNANCVMSEGTPRIKKTRVIWIMYMYIMYLDGKCNTSTSILPWISRWLSWQPDGLSQWGWPRRPKQRNHGVATWGIWGNRLICVTNGELTIKNRGSNIKTVTWTIPKLVKTFWFKNDTTYSHVRVVPTSQVNDCGHA